MDTNQLDQNARESQAFIMGFIKKSDYKIVFYCKEELKPVVSEIFYRIIKLLSQEPTGATCYTIEGEISE